MGIVRSPSAQSIHGRRPERVRPEARQRTRLVTRPILRTIPPGGSTHARYPVRPRSSAISIRSRTEATGVRTTSSARSTTSLPRSGWPRRRQSARSSRITASLRLGGRSNPGPAPDVRNAAALHAIHRPRSDSDSAASAAHSSSWGGVYHGATITHLDALCHIFWDGRMYNGKPAELATASAGADPPRRDRDRQSDGDPRRAPRHSPVAGPCLARLARPRSRSTWRRPRRDRGSRSSRATCSS